MDSAILFTLASLFGGMVLDQGKTSRRRPTLRQSLIDTLLTSLTEGSFGPLRLVEREEGMYLTGCGVMHPVRSREEAEKVAGELVNELRGGLGGLDPQMLIEPIGLDDPKATEDLRTPEVDDEFEDLMVCDPAEAVAWQEWPDTGGQICETIEAAASPTPVDEPAPPTEAPPSLPAARAPTLSIVDVQEEKPLTEPCPITLEPLALPHPSQHFRRIDKTLDEIMSRMVSRCAAL